MQVDFMIIGAQKSGTTSLAAQLAAHTAICFSEKKEPGFFNAHVDWRADLPQYHAGFAPEPNQLLGEASTMYTFFPEYVDTYTRLWEYNRDLKLIYVMRNPVSRIVSHYTHNLVRGLEQASPEKAIIDDPRYVNRSRYAVQIRPYLALFGPDQILLLTFEEYVADQVGVLLRVAHFLGINGDEFLSADLEAKHQSTGAYYLKSQKVESLVGTSQFQKLREFVPAPIRQTIRHHLFSNRIDERPVFSPALKQLIWQLVEDDVSGVEELLGRPLTEWHN